MTTLILGLISPTVWLPPVAAVILTVLTGSEFKSIIVLTNLKLLLSTLYTKYVPVLIPVAEPS